MKRSEQINELAAALSKAQGQMEAAIKGSDNPFFKSRYADLAEVWNACRKPLSDNGLAVIQGDGDVRLDDSICIETMVVHSSGQWVSTTLIAKPKDMSPQGIGSCITYLRRYGLQSAVGIAPEDDDGNAASNPVNGNHFAKPVTTAAKPAAKATSAKPVETAKPEPVVETEAAKPLESETLAMVDKLFDLLSRHAEPLNMLVNVDKLMDYLASSSSTKMIPTDITKADTIAKYIIKTALDKVCDKI